MTGPAKIGHIWHTKFDVIVEFQLTVSFEVLVL